MVSVHHHVWWAKQLSGRWGAQGGCVGTQRWQLAAQAGSKRSFRPRRLGTCCVCHGQVAGGGAA